MNKELQQHWENVYETKSPDEVSWTQKVPELSLQWIEEFSLPKSASIIDIGGGDSTLVDHLLERGYENITVLDISAAAIAKAQQRLGEQAKKVTWIQTDITDFKPTRSYDLWHDRATFHFLTEPEAVEKYLEIAGSCVNEFLMIGTFSISGPARCSGLPVTQYSERKLAVLFNKEFEKMDCTYKDHITPFRTLQNFLFCVFKKKKITGG